MLKCGKSLKKNDIASCGNDNGCDETTTSELVQRQRRSVALKAKVAALKADAIEAEVLIKESGAIWRAANAESVASTVLATAVVVAIVIEVLVAVSVELLLWRKSGGCVASRNFR